MNKFKITSFLSNWLWDKAESTPVEQEKNWLAWLKQHPDSSKEHYRYAWFLWNTRKDYDRAEEYFNKALDLEPDSKDITATILGAYGRFLKDERQDYYKAKDCFKKRWIGTRIVFIA
jgi:tetratricopeptide (TPR) repeat protein